MPQTPWVDFMETVYRYRFQGTIFEDREGFLSSSDVGATSHYNFPGNYGDVHGGFYNGETYTRAEVITKSSPRRGLPSGGSRCMRSLPSEIAALH